MLASQVRTQQHEFERAELGSSATCPTEPPDEQSTSISKTECHPGQCRATNCCNYFSTFAQACAATVLGNSIPTTLSSVNGSMANTKSTLTSNALFRLLSASIMRGGLNGSDAPLWREGTSTSTPSESAVFHGPIAAGAGRTNRYFKTVCGRFRFPAAPKAPILVLVATKMKGEGSRFTKQKMYAL